MAKRHVPGNLYLSYGKQDKTSSSQTATGSEEFNHTQGEEGGRGLTVGLDDLKGLFKV